MAKDTFELDFKAYLPRMRRFRKKLDPDSATWQRVKEFVRSPTPIDWEHFIKHFQVGKLLCPEDLRPASREAHQSLKGVYAFLQLGYIVRNGDSVALYARIDKKQRITTGHSILLSATPSNLRDHTPGIQKVESHIDCSLTSVVPKPFALGYTELQHQGADRYPAYVWLVHELVYPGKLPKVRSSLADRDSFVGMKKLAALRAGEVRSGGKQSQINGVFDQLLIEMLATNRETAVASNAVLRKLTPQEVLTIPTDPFKQRNEKLRARLKLLGLLTLVTAGGLPAAAQVIDWATRTQWVQENWIEITGWLQSLAQLGSAYFST